MNKIAIVTGANSGLGLETTKYLLNHGYHVIMGCRNEQKVLALGLDNTTFIYLDLSIRDSIRDFSQTVINEFGQVDLLVNNAGIMVPPYKLTNEIESQIDTNYVGHFYLTSLLVNNIKEGGRVVNVSSLAGKNKTFNYEIAFDYYNDQNNYNNGSKIFVGSGFDAYRMSKFYNACFSYTLANKLDEYKVKVLTAHPGVCDTNIFSNRYVVKLKPIAKKLYHIAEVSDGVEAIIKAIESDAPTGSFYGPVDNKEKYGPVGLVDYHPLVLDKDFCARLWKWTEECLGIEFKL